jgi:hypothetical protein
MTHRNTDSMPLNEFFPCRRSRIGVDISGTRGVKTAHNSQVDPASPKSPIGSQQTTFLVLDLQNLQAKQQFLKVLDPATARPSETPPPEVADVQRSDPAWPAGFAESPVLGQSSAIGAELRICPFHFNSDSSRRSALNPRSRNAMLRGK